MSSLITFENMEFGKLTVIEKDGEFFFIGNEIAELLGYSNYRKAVMVHVDEEDKLRSQIGYAGQMREVTLINESGLYSLILSSKLPQAKEFKRWVTKDVLPSIRKNGGYIRNLMSKSSKGEKGQYFTPRYVIDMCVKMLNPKKTETMIDKIGRAHV